MGILDEIIGVQEASELWGLSADRIKQLCQTGEIEAKKIGKTWVILKNQQNPKKYNTGVKNMRTLINGIECRVHAQSWGNEVYLDTLDEVIAYLESKKALQAVNNFKEYFYDEGMMNYRMFVNEFCISETFDGLVIGAGYCGDGSMSYKELYNNKID